jgi:hypothetical protein
VGNLLSGRGRHRQLNFPLSFGIEKVLNLLYWKQKAEYISGYPLPESVERLRRVVKSLGWNPVPPAGVYGKVSENKVRLYRLIPFWHNSFSPFFMGAFGYSNGRVMLSGAYSMHPVVKVFMTLWFIGVLFGIFGEIIIFLPQLISGKITLHDLNPMLLVPFGLLLFGILLVKSGQWFSRNDINYISHIIRDAIQ